MKKALHAVGGDVQLAGAVSQTDTNGSEYSELGLRIQTEYSELNKE